jgi:hypothetical protein
LTPVPRVADLQPGTPGTSSSKVSAPTRETPGQQSGNRGGDYEPCISLWNPSGASRASPNESARVSSGGQETCLLGDSCLCGERSAPLLWQRSCSVLHGPRIEAPSVSGRGFPARNRLLLSFTFIARIGLTKDGIRSHPRSDPLVGRRLPQRPQVDDNMRALLSNDRGRRDSLLWSHQQGLIRHRFHLQPRRAFPQSA